jgi:hypothetical protein
LSASKARVRIREADLSIGQGGVEARERDKNSGTIVTIEEGDIALPERSEPRPLYSGEEDRRSDGALLNYAVTM